MLELNELLTPANNDQYPIIREALKEDENRLENNVNLLENWISYQKHLPQNYDRRILYAYIRGCKHDLEKTKKKIELFFAIKSTQHDLFADRIISEDHDLKAMNFTIVITLPNYTPQGCRVTVFKLTNANIEVFDQKSLIRYGLIMADYRAHVDNFCGGEVLIFDPDETTAAIASKCINSLSRRSIQIIQDAYPSMIKQIHIITTKAFIEKSINITKHFLKEKLRNRIHVHKNYETLSKFIPLECLPSDYGGKQESLRNLNEKWKRMYIQEKEFFQKLDEVKLQGPIPCNMVENYNEEDDVGLQGSFRKLNID